MSDTRVVRPGLRHAGPCFAQRRIYRTREMISHQRSRGVDSRARKSAMDAQNVVEDFVARINAHDPGRIAGLCTPGHVFTDSLGGTVTGREELEEGWRGYFGLFPDYRIEIKSLLAEGDLVLACGFASATHQPSGISWRIPAAWRAVVRDSRVGEWQVFADNKPVYDLFAEQSPK